MTRFSVLIFSAMLSFAGCAAREYSCEVEADRVTMNLKLPDAQKVAFASSLDGYQVRPAENLGRGRWVIQQPAAKQFAYFFIVDGAVYLPDCRFKEDDDFGARNCLYLPGL